MNHTHEIVVLILIGSLLLILGLQRVRFLAPLINFGILLGLAVGITATALMTHSV